MQTQSHWMKIDGQSAGVTGIHINTMRQAWCYQRYLSASLPICFVAVIAIITYMYVSSEHTFYYWDYSAYQDMTVAKAMYFRDIPKDWHEMPQMLKQIWKSTREDYSDFHTLLIIPFIMTFGNSRVVYILGLGLAYLVPFIVVLGAIATKLVPYSRRAVFGSTIIIAVLTPGIWIPTLRGYPDAGAATLLALAILIYLNDMELTRWWRRLTIGLCIALAILFRRHFIYGGIAFFVAITLLALLTCAIQYRQHRKEALFNFGQAALRIGLTAGCTVVIIGLLGWPFVERVLHTNFGELYASYEVSFFDGLRYFGTYYGWIGWFLAAIGIAVGLVSRVVSSRPVIFVAAFGIFSLLQWTLTVKKLGLHYSLHFALFIVLGLVALIWSISLLLKGKIRTVALSIGSAYLLFNAAVGFGYVGNLNASRFGVSPTELLGQRHGPLQRSDYNEIARLIQYLRDRASPDDSIYIAASSDVLSDSLLWHAERTLHEDVYSNSLSKFWRNGSLNILATQTADSRDQYPIEKLLQSQYVIIASPFQHHMAANEQDVVKVVVDAFVENWEIAQDFTRLPEEFHMIQGVGVVIYARNRPTSLGTTLRTLKTMRQRIGRRPGGQPSWISLNGVTDYYDSYVEQNRNHTYNLKTDSAVHHGKYATSFLYLEKLSGHVVVTGELIQDTSQCNPAFVTFTAIDDHGLSMQTAKVVDHFAEALKFSISLPTPDSSYLLLEISGNESSNNNRRHCSLRVHNLGVSVQ